MPLGPIQKEKQKVRNKDIERMANVGVTLLSIGKKYNITRERVRQICEELNIGRPIEIRQKNYKKELEKELRQILVDSHKIISYNQIRKKYHLKPSKILDFKTKLGINLGNQIKEFRTNEMIKLYKQGLTASEIALIFEYKNPHDIFSITYNNTSYRKRGKAIYNKDGSIRYIGKTQVKHNQIKKLYQQLGSFKKVSEIMKIPYSTARAGFYEWYKKSTKNENRKTKN